MDFLNKTFAQLNDLFRSMTPAARITAALLLAVVVVSLGYLFTFRASGADTDLMNGVPVAASQLPRMEAAFHEAGLNTYQVRGTQILVPRGRKNAYMAALADAKALPPNIEDVFDRAMEDTSPFVSKNQRAQRLKIAKQKTLGMIIGSMAGIESAYVLYDTEIKSGFNREKVTTASASVKPAGSEQLNQEQVSAIRHLVAGAIAGLKPESVTVADLNGRTYNGNAEGGGSPLDDPYGARKRMYERQWKAKILDALSYVPGVTVTPNVELDRVRLNRSRQVQYDAKATAYLEIDKSSSTSQQGGGPAGRPGYASNAAMAPQTLHSSTAAGSREDGEDSQREVRSLVPGEQIEKESIGLTPKLVKVSVGVPSSYFQSVWRERNPAKEGEEPKTPEQAALQTIRQEESGKIQNHVAALLPLAEGVEDSTSLVTVTEFTDIPGEKIPAPPITSSAVAWLAEYWGMLGIIGLAVFSLLILRSMIRATPATPASAGPRLPAKPEQAEATRAATPAAGRLGRFTGGGPSLRDELSELVKEDPDVAANVLKTWISHVG